MSNPWLKKNPFMSMWLSSANAVAGAARGRVTAELNRQAKAASAAVVKEFVTAGMPVVAAKKRSRKTTKTATPRKRR